jgi:hypothetical protein
VKIFNAFFCKMPRKLSGHKTSVVIPFDTYEDLGKIADKESRSISQMASILISEAIDARKNAK